MRKLAAVVVWLSLLCSPTYARSDTLVCGPIDVDTAWTLAGSPYIVTCSVIVRNDATLTIAPGVQVRFSSEATLWIGTVAFGRATLIADAGSGDPILLTSDAPSPAPGDWGGIEFLASAVGATLARDTYVSGSILRNCVIEYAGSDPDGRPSLKTASNPAILDCVIRNGARGGVSLRHPESTEVLLSGCTIRDLVTGVYPTILTAGGSVRIIGCTIENNGRGLDLRGPSVVVEETVVRNNFGTGINAFADTLRIYCSIIEQNSGGATSVGVDVNQGHVFQMSQSNLSNLGFELRNDTLMNLDVRNNWWGTTDRVAIEGEIFHCFDSPFVGCAEFEPFRLEPVPLGTCGVTVAMENVTWGHVKLRYR